MSHLGINIDSDGENCALWQSVQVFKHPLLLRICLPSMHGESCLALLLPFMVSVACGCFLTASSSSLLHTESGSLLVPVSAGGWLMIYPELTILPMSCCRYLEKKYILSG